MLIYAITELGDLGGRVAISNYSELTIPDKCIWGDPNTDDFGEFYETQFRPLWAEAGFAAWTTEWAGEWGSCSPCSGVQITQEDLDALGFQGDLTQHFLTRLHVRYTPDTATQDLMLYASGLRDAKVTSFADDNEGNRSCIAVCGEDATEADPDDGVPWEGSEQGGDDTPADPSADKGSGCAAVGGGGVLASLLAGGLLGLRRREDEAPAQAGRV
jgi:hypothetical protein